MAVGSCSGDVTPVVADATPARIDWSQVTWSFQHKGGGCRRLGRDQTDLSSFPQLLSPVVPVTAGESGDVQTPEVTLRWAQTLGKGVYGVAHKVTMHCPQYSGRELPDLVFKTGFIEREEEKVALKREAAFWLHLYGEPARISFFTDAMGIERYSLVCRYHSGKTFHHYLSRKKKTFEQHLRMLDAVLARLAWLHNEKKVIHGDLKPANIVIQKKDGGYQAEFVDFGISYRTDEKAVTFDCDASKTYWHPDRCREREYIPIVR